MMHSEPITRSPSSFNLTPNSQQAKHPRRLALPQRQPPILSVSAARSSQRSTNRARRQNASLVSANPPPSSWRACRIFLRRASAASSPPAGRDPRSEWPACGPPWLPKVPRRTWREIVPRIRWRAEFAAPRAVLEGREPPLSEEQLAHSHPQVLRGELTLGVCCLRAFRPWGLEAV